MVPLSNIVHPPEDAGTSVTRRAPKRNTHTRKQKKYMRSDFFAQTRTMQLTFSKERMNGFERNKSNRSMLDSFVERSRTNAIHSKEEASSLV
jgi:hypothetical protein